MERWLLTVETNCSDPLREDDFNEWYDKVHLPDILTTPGFVRAARYVNNAAGQGQAKFLAVYEIETENIERTMATFAANVDAQGRQGRISDILMPVGGGLYRQVTAPLESK